MATEYLEDSEIADADDDEVEDPTYELGMDLADPEDDDEEEEVEDVDADEDVKMCLRASLADLPKRECCLADSENVMIENLLREVDFLEWDLQAVPIQCRNFHKRSKDFWEHISEEMGDYVTGRRRAINNIIKKFKQDDEESQEAPAPRARA